MKQLQAKSISDDDVLRAIDAGHGSIWELESALNYPPKVVLAKLRSLVKRGVLHGCTCGCRGDFRRTEP